MEYRTPPRNDTETTDSRIAQRLRRCFDAHDVLALSLIGATGAGKTALLEETLPHLPSQSRAIVLAADVGTGQDLSRLVGYGCDVVLAGMNGKGCLSARTVAEHLCPTCLHDNVCLPLFDMLFIENAGSLALSNEFDLGETCRVLVTSVAEDDDEPLKYSKAFSSADVVIVNKIDLQSHLQFGMDRFRRSLDRVNGRAEVIEISCRTGEGIDCWLHWITARLDALWSPERERAEAPPARADWSPGN